jgi:hypothetical protein
MVCTPKNQTARGISLNQTGSLEIYCRLETANYMKTGYNNTYLEELPERIYTVIAAPEKQQQQLHLHSRDIPVLINFNS